MKKSVLASMTFILVAALALIGGTAAAAGDTAAGNSIIDRPGTDIATNFYLVDKNLPFTAGGDVREWEIFARNTNPVQLVIYRYSNGWSVVGKSGTVTPAVGYNRFQLATPIPVQQGDYVGLYFPNGGSVTFSVDGAFNLGNLAGTALHTATGGGETAFVDSSNRVYSVRASSVAQGNTVGGNPIIDRTTSDGRTNFYIVDRNRPFTANGDVREWEIWAENTNQVQLVLYRFSNVWSVVGRSDLVTPAVGYNRFQLSSSIPVQRGDFVGLFYPNGGSVSLSVDGPGNLGNLSGSVLFTDSGGGQTSFTDSSNRIYSVRASSGVRADHDDGDDEGPGRAARAHGKRKFAVRLSGEGAGVDTDARGKAKFRLSKDGNTLRYKLTVANIQNVTAAQIYLGTDSSNVAVWLYPSDPPAELIPGRFQGVLDKGKIAADDLVGPLSGKSIADLMEEIRAGHAFVNVRTSQYPNGEIRGELGLVGRAADRDEDDDDDDEEDRDEARGNGHGWSDWDDRDGGKDNDKGKEEGQGRDDNKDKEKGQGRDKDKGKGHKD